MKRLKVLLFRTDKIDMPEKPYRINCNKKAMSTKYKATMPDTGYFVTITIVGCCGHGLQIRAIGF